MAKNVFDIQWEGLDALEKEFDKMDKKFTRILAEEYTKYGKLVEEGTKALAPQDESDLTDSINFDKAEITRTGVTVEGGASSEYALRRHEEPYREGTYPKYDNGAKFEDYYVDGRGLATRLKPNWRGYMPGRKYMENAIKATQRDYNKMNQRILDRTLGERK